MLDTPAPRPDDLDVAGIWESVVDEVEQRRVARDGDRARPRRSSCAWCGTSSGGTSTVLGADDDGRVRLEVASHTARSVAEKLAGFGAAVEVLEPAAVRDELAALGAELVARYAPRPS